MIRKFPGHDTDNPPGCINYERPFVQAVEEYEAASHEKALQDAYKRGYESGYQTGYQTGLTKAVLTSHLCIDPTSEASR